MNIFSYLVLLSIFLVVLCAVIILAITCRTCARKWCCPNTAPPAEDDESVERGRNNPGFDDQEAEIRSVRPRPFDAMEQPEAPPTYEEAVRQELFRYPLPTILVPQRSDENANFSADNELPSTSTASSSSSSSNLEQPSTSQLHSPTNQRHRNQMSRSRSSTSSSGVLSTISEEDEYPVQIVIDCIGIQASRLLENCDKTVNLTNGNELKTNSEC